MMIQKIRSFEKYESFIGELARDPLYSDPHFTFDKENLYSSLERQDEFTFAVLENEEPQGIFVWLVLTNDQYIEMIIGFTKKEAFSEMLSYMERKYQGFNMDFVFNPLNPAISRTLKMKGAAFDPEQQKMMQNGIVPSVSTDQIEILSEKWTKQYCDLHNKDTYWTAERILSDKNNFRVLLAVKEGLVQGYLDITCGHEENERYATRMVEVFCDKSVRSVKEEGFNFVTEACVPSVQEINREPEFSAEIISKTEFEEVYNSKKYKGHIEFPK